MEVRGEKNVQYYIKKYIFMNDFSRKNPQLLHAVDKFLIIIMIIMINAAVLPSVGHTLQLHDMMSIKLMKL